MAVYLQFCCNLKRILLHTNVFTDITLNSIMDFKRFILKAYAHSFALAT